jgi:hypothetical protein
MVPQGVIAELGDLRPGQHTDLHIRLHVPDLAAHGRTRLAGLELSYFTSEGAPLHLQPIDVVVTGEGAQDGRDAPAVASEGRLLFKSLMEQVDDLAGRVPDLDLEAVLREFLESGRGRTGASGTSTPDAGLLRRVQDLLFELRSWVWEPPASGPAAA